MLRGVSTENPRRTVSRPAAIARREDLAHAKAAENALQEWIVSPRVNRSGVSDDDPALIEAA